MRKNPYVKSVNIRVTENDYNVLKKLADDNNQRLGEFVRTVLETKVIKDEENERVC